ncbi:putative quorum-sensing-regulated virulence factor [Photobacterium lucens]|uniref:putative quorum-sensing-regulated virulence factor n=1 Tax=Photobacterium lucens TaxID=2562949 RepID=UPI00292A404A|nr:DUF3820 family protein [Photobacterium lucens]
MRQYKIKKNKKILKKSVILWLQKKGFPEGELGTLMALALEFKIEGLESVIRPLRRD